MTSTFLGLLGVILGAIIAAVGSVLVARTSARTAGDSSLWGRVSAVEAEVKELRAELEDQDRTIRAASTFIDRIGLWLESGMRSTRPKPPHQLRPHIETSFWTREDDHAEHHPPQ